jgi:membrane protein DedA with SNARE-associated domain
MCGAALSAKAGAVLADLSTLAGWAYVLLALVVALDAVLPLVPGEVAVVGGGAMVAADPVPLLAAAWLGALAGDCVAYGLGRRAGRLGVGRLFRHRQGRATLVWATRQLGRVSQPAGGAGRCPDPDRLRCRRRRYARISSTPPPCRTTPGRRPHPPRIERHALDRRTVPVLVAGRFLPGGRTVTTLTAGFLRVPPSRFVPAAALGGALWAGYVAGLGYLGGRGAAEQPWAGALAGLLLATAAGLTLEGVRRLRARPEPAPAAGEREPAATCSS